MSLPTRSSNKSVTRGYNTLAKNLKLKIKNTQLAKALNLSGIKSKLKKNVEETEKKENEPKQETQVAKVAEEAKANEPIRRAKKKSSFVPGEEPIASEELTDAVESPPLTEIETSVEEVTAPLVAKESSESQESPVMVESEKTNENSLPEAPLETPKPEVKAVEATVSKAVPNKSPVAAKAGEANKRPQTPDSDRGAPKPKVKDWSKEKKNQPPVKPKPGTPEAGSKFDSRARRGLKPVASGEQPWRKKRPSWKQGRKMRTPEPVIRPSNVSVRLPIAIKDLASEMKLKASQLIAKLFMQGVVHTLNDYLDDETTIQLLGQEFDCEILIDTTEEERIRITDKSVAEEIAEGEESKLLARPPVIAFMGHVDHGKTSIIDSIRKTTMASGEAGAITQHIGAFRYKADGKDITIIDTPGHAAFSAMRARGAEVTDIVILVIAGDEGIRQQTKEAIQHAKAAEVPIIVAINKNDKPGFDPENVYRQLADAELLPEAWGGTTITVNCSAITGEGISDLLDMVGIQSEVMELRSNPESRARGTIIESEMHKGLGAVATILVQNGTLKKGDALVLGSHFGRVKTMRNEQNKELAEASASTPVEITGLSGLPEAGEEFIVVANEKEAREIAATRMDESRGRVLIKQKKGISIESLLQSNKDSQKKVLNLVLRADMQGSLEALKAAVENITSDKIETNVIFSGAGEISESDVQLAAASKAIIVGFHTQVESHAEALIKDLDIKIYVHDIIYHAIDNIKEMMTGMLDKLAKEEDTGAADVRATFKVSALGVIAGCFVSEGNIKRNHLMRVIRDGEVVWKGNIRSLKREKDDVREVVKGLECGILLDGYNDILEGDVLQAYEIIYLSQEL
ncbi:MAG: translation initiation factor IF-2 [Halioglobus sp.]